MPTPDYIAAIRRVYGQGRLLLPGVSAVVLRTDLEPGRVHILLTRRSDTGRWSLPAGIVEPFEQPAAAILRELLEETRITADVERLALLRTDPDVVYPNGDRCQFVAMCFRCRYVSGEAQVGDEESTEVAWFPADDLPNELTDIQVRRIRCALEDRDACVFDL
ncbi:MAG TPA: NUDIX domain-containing protein [Propionibacteriaceae bacterium]|nr:NUDIX domain-containing protein [Propionibacteriaceae bacterium]